ncbi:unconventional myosin-Va-like [Zophobas morio]|uniref:unconventional myosin-Va-like n=1 Tax=Zophobas morio TaxID=2755281 RepID=UPI003083A5E0
MTDFIKELEDIYNLFTLNGIPVVVTSAVFSRIAKFISHYIIKTLTLGYQYCTWNKSLRILENIGVLREWFKEKNFDKGEDTSLDSAVQALTLIKNASKLSDTRIFLKELNPLEIRKILTNYHGDYGEKISQQTISQIIAQCDPNETGLILMPAEELSPPEISVTDFFFPQYDIVDFGPLKELVI